MCCQWVNPWPSLHPLLHLIGGRENRLVWENYWRCVSHCLLPLCGNWLEKVNIFCSFKSQVLRGSSSCGQVSRLPALPPMLARGFHFSGTVLNKSTDLKSWSLIKTFQFEKKKERCIFFFYLCLILTPLLIDPQLGQERRSYLSDSLKPQHQRELLCLAFNNCLVGDIGLLLMGSQNFVAEIWDRNIEASWLSSSHLQSEWLREGLLIWSLWKREGGGFLSSHPSSMTKLSWNKQVSC